MLVLLDNGLSRVFSHLKRSQMHLARQAVARMKPGTTCVVPCTTASEARTIGKKCTQSVGINAGLCK